MEGDQTFDYLPPVLIANCVLFMCTTFYNTTRVCGIIMTDIYAQPGTYNEHCVFENYVFVVDRTVFL